MSAIMVVDFLGGERDASALSRALVAAGDDGRLVVVVSDKRGAQVHGAVND